MLENPDVGSKSPINLLYSKFASKLGFKNAGLIKELNVLLILLTRDKLPSSSQCSKVPPKRNCTLRKRKSDKISSTGELENRIFDYVCPAAGYTALQII